MAISKDGRRLEMNGTLIALVEDVQIRRSVEHLSGKHKKKEKKRKEKKERALKRIVNLLTTSQFPIWKKHSNPLR